MVDVDAKRRDDPSADIKAGVRPMGDHSAETGSKGTVDLIGQAAEPFDAIDSADLSPLLERIGNARLVLIGEATHGTSEFYRMRQHITKQLVERRGFNVIAVEADWPDAEKIDEYVRNRPGKPERAFDAFSRFPSWMWRNFEVLEFIEWLRDYNDGLAGDDPKVGFYGLDLYSLHTSIDEVLRYLQSVDPDLAAVARKRYDCFEPFQSDPGRYGSAVISNRYRECEEEVTKMLDDLLRKRLEYTTRDGESYLDAEQNARVVASAEQYYRLMYHGSHESWNHRDTHMFETLIHLLEHRGPDAKAVVWAHNSHVGDASATSMSARGETNIGELVRKRSGLETFLIGFGTHTGVVAAASSWGGSVEFKDVRPSHPESYEHLCHLSGRPRFLLSLGDTSTPIVDALMKSRLERAIGVIYRPRTELQSHYFRAVLPKQFDEYIWFDRSESVRPLDRAEAPGLPQRHPFLLAD